MYKEIINVGVFDNDIDLFEGQYTVPDGITYNSYVVMGNTAVAVIDSVDLRFSAEWLENIGRATAKAPDYLVIQHMEPDHSGSILAFVEKYPKAKLVASAKAHAMLSAFFPDMPAVDIVTVAEGGVLELGGRALQFYTAPMVHWPEVIVTFDENSGTLFSADAFGRFGPPDVDYPWSDEARRYYIGIVGKYGKPVTALLKKLSTLNISSIAPLHGPVLSGELEKYIGLYTKWSAYQPEQEGTVIAYATIYGGTREAAELLADKIYELSGTRPELYDLARCDKHAAIAAAFRYSRLVLCSATYNGDAFPPMREYIAALVERGYTNRTVYFIENGSWAPTAAKAMRAPLENIAGLTLGATVTVKSRLNADSRAAIFALAEGMV